MPRGKDEEERRRRRARATQVTADWRSRVARNVDLAKIEYGAPELDLAIRYGGLKASETGNKELVAAALSRLLHKMVVSFLREVEGSK